MNVFITGVTKGLGKALAGEFLNKGYSVWGVGRRYSEEHRENFYYSVCDVTRPEDVKRTYEEMRNKGFIPDIVILNAAIMEDDLAPEFSCDMFKKTFNINLFGSMNWIELFLPPILKKRGGTFVAISSLSAHQPLIINKVAYPSSKAALGMAFRTFRIRFVSSGLRFITFHIGPMGGEQKLFQISYEKAAKKIVKHLCLNRKSNVVNFPFIPTLITKVSRFLPDIFISRVLLKIK